MKALMNFKILRISGLLGSMIQTKQLIEYINHDFKGHGLVLILLLARIIKGIQKGTEIFERSLKVLVILSFS